MLFERNANAYDPAPDGKRFLLITQDTPGQSSEIRVVLNWVEELKRRVPLGN
jgi:hypothetical protein